MTETFHPPSSMGEEPLFAALGAFATNLATELRHAANPLDLPDLVERAFIGAWPAMAAMPAKEPARALTIAEVAAVAGYCAGLRSAAVSSLRTTLDALAPDRASAKS